MKLLSRVGASALALVLLVSGLTGCQQQKTVKPEEQLITNMETLDLTKISDSIAATTGLSWDTVVGTVAGHDLTLGMVYYHATSRCDAYLQNYYYYGITELPWETEMEDGKTMEEAILREALDYAALYSIIPDLAADEGIDVGEETNAEIEEALTSMEESLGGAQGLEYFLWWQPMNETVYEQLMTVGTLYGKLQDTYYGAAGTKLPTDAQLLGYFEDELGYYKAKHILLATVDTTQAPTLSEDGASYVYPALDDGIVAEKTTLAEDIIAQLNASDDPIALFDQLMAEYSEDTAADGTVNGASGYVCSPGQMVPGFENGAKALSAGEISGIVESTYGYHIILRMELDAADVSLDEYIGEQMYLLEESLLDGNEIVTNEVFDTLDLSVFYENLTTLRETLTAEITALQEAAAGDTSSAGDTSGSSSAADASGSSSTGG